MIVCSNLTYTLSECIGLFLQENQFVSPVGHRLAVEPEWPSNNGWDGVDLLESVIIELSW